MIYPGDEEGPVGPTDETAEPERSENLIISGSEALADQAQVAQGDAEPGDLSIGLQEAAPQEFLVPSRDSTMLGAEGAVPQESEAPLAEPAADPDGSDANLSVDELLGEAVAAEAAQVSAHVAPAPDVPPSQVPTFQLHLHGLTDEKRPVLRKLLEAQGLSMPEKSGGAPVISQLTEFQAVLLLQGARALGIPATGSVQLPQPALSEDELALGDLSLVVEEAGAPTAESAPSVSLPRGEKDVMLCSPVQMPGLKTQESLGIVIAHRSIARRLFREEDMREKLEKELRSVPGRGASGMASSHLQQVLRDLFLDLRKGALSKGANAVLGVKLEAFPESASVDPQLEQLRLVAFGTAAVVEKT